MRRLTGLPDSLTTNRKFLVLLTDGVQTSGEFGVDGSRSVAHGNNNLVEALHQHGRSRCHRLHHRL